jgi:hypothetical protein
VAPNLARNKKSGALATTVGVPNQGHALLGPGPAQLIHALPLTHVLNVRLSLHQRPLTSLLPRPSIFLSSPSRLSGCRPSFIDNHKAQPLLERRSFSFTSLVGVTVVPLHLYAIHHFHLTTSFSPNRLIDLCKSRRFLGPAH